MRDEKQAHHAKNPARQRPLSGNPAKRARQEASGARHRSLPSLWIEAARIRTLPVSIAPIAVGTGAALAAMHGNHQWKIALLCLAVSVLLQIGVNYSNDYSDGVRGTDEHRVGPARLTASGRVPAKRVRAVAFVFFGLAAMCGIAVAILSGFWWLIPIGIACVAAAWFYTGGKHPYGYYGLGEVFVFVFFGLVATLGTCFAQIGRLTGDAWLGAIAIGLLACAVLVINNIRDREQDRAAKKRTLTVLIGHWPSVILFAVLILAPFGMLIPFTFVYPKALIAFIGLLPAIPAVVIAIWGRTPREYITALQLSGITILLYGLALGYGIGF